MKHIRHQDARRALRMMWRSVKVLSCADGSIKLRPEWADERHGLFTRLHAAAMVEAVLGITSATAARSTSRR